MRHDEDTLTTAHGAFFVRRYCSSEGVGMALWKGDVAGDPHVATRMHSSCFTSEGLGALDCDCVAQLDDALRTIAEAGRGVVFYLLQEGRGAGLRAKFRDREIVQRSGGAIDTFAAYAELGLPPDPRTYGLVPPMCRALGLPPTLRLMTNNPAKIAALTAAGIGVERVARATRSSDYNADYLEAKVRSGHTMHVATKLRAITPPSLDALDPKLDVLAGFRRIASYALPLRHRDGSAWFRATLYGHERSGHDRVVLTHRREPAAREVRHVFREVLTERITEEGAHAARYRAAIARTVDHGAGTILAIPSDAALLSTDGGPTLAEDEELLVAHGAALGATSWERVA